MDSAFATSSREVAKEVDVRTMASQSGDEVKAIVLAWRAAMEVVKGGDGVDIVGDSDSGSNGWARHEEDGPLADSVVVPFSGTTSRSMPEGDLFRKDRYCSCVTSIF